MRKHVARVVRLGAKVEPYLTIALIPFGLGLILDGLVDHYPSRFTIVLAGIAVAADAVDRLLDATKPEEPSDG